MRDAHGTVVGKDSSPPECIHRSPAARSQAGPDIPHRDSTNLPHPHTRRNRPPAPAPGAFEPGMSPAESVSSRARARLTQPGYCAAYHWGLPSTPNVVRHTSLQHRRTSPIPARPEAVAHCFLRASVVACSAPSRSRLVPATGTRATFDHPEAHTPGLPCPCSVRRLPQRIGGFFPDRPRHRTFPEPPSPRLRYHRVSGL